MRRLSGVLLAGAILLLPAFSQHASAQNAPQKTTYTGDVVLAAYVVNAAQFVLKLRAARQQEARRRVSTAEVAA